MSKPTATQQARMSNAKLIAAVGCNAPASEAGNGARRSGSTRCSLWLALTLAAATWSTGAAADAVRELRVCADPDNFPFSNQRLEGFENKIAEVIASDLRATVRYTWHPQRRGFIRQTLAAKHCDLIIGVPSGLEPVLSTKPYYSSTYVFVYAKNRKLDDLRSFDDPVLQDLKIGLQAFGDDGANLPPAHALARRGITRNVVGFSMLDTADSPSGKIIDAVATGEIDVAIVWGPFAGNFVKRQPVELVVVPVSASTDRVPLPFTFDVSLGVRRGDAPFKEELEGVLDRRREEIREILETFGVPLVDKAPMAALRSSVISGR
jgi:mxaJ protein